MSAALIVDDEADLCRLMQMTLTKMGIDSDVAYDISTAHKLLSQSEYDFCLTDMRLPDGSGLDLVKYITNNYCDMPVAVITAHGNMDIAIDALKLGAFDFVNKPLELPRLRQLIEHALKVTEENQDAINVEEQSAHPDSELQLPTKSNADIVLDKHLIGNSQAITQLKATIIKLARSQAPVFLWGESGTGKEVVAKLIHKLSPRRSGEFIAVNCGAIPSELMESEFFGHKKGSFTGATADKKGLFQQADGGTLFLDEVADLPLSMQVKLLRAIQEKSVRAIGDTKEVPVDIRLLSATHKDLNQLVQTGEFRQDLFYRINVIELKLPRLNERSGDIELLAQYFLDQIADEWQLDSTPALSYDAKQALQQHRFEGNVRELRNLLERAITLADSDTLTAEHLGLRIQPSTDDNAAQNSSHNPLSVEDITQLDTIKADTYNSADIDTYSVDSKTIQIQTEQDSQTNTITHNATSNFNNKISTGATTDTGDLLTSSQSTHHIPTSHFAQSYSSNTQSTDDLVADGVQDATQQEADSHQHLASKNLPEEGLEAYLQDQERQLIIIALNKTNGNKTKAAKLLGTSFRSLRYRMKKLEIDTDTDTDTDTDGIDSED